MNVLHLDCTGGYTREETSKLMNYTFKMCNYISKELLKKTQPSYLLFSPTTDSGTSCILMPASMA